VGDQSLANKYPRLFLNSTQKVRIFVWRLMRNRLATRDNLKARNLVIEGYDFSCPFCNSVEESV